MTTLHNELERLYLLPGQIAYLFHPDQDDQPQDSEPCFLTQDVLARTLTRGQGLTVELVTPARTVRTLVISVEPGTVWLRIAQLHDGIQADLALPAPALAISGSGYQLWFSLAEPLPIEQAHRFLQGLVRKYLGDLPLVRCYPALEADPSCRMNLVPGFQKASQRWSAFISQDLGGMFAEEPGLDMAPALGGQADILSGLQSIQTEDFKRALTHLEAVLALSTAGATATEVELGRYVAPEGRYQDPEQFLMAVMNDPACPLPHRIEAAKALLPYVKKVPTP